MRLQTRTALQLFVAASVASVPIPALTQALVTHRIPAALAVEAAMEAINFCAKDGYQESAVVVDASGAHQAEIRGDGATTYTLDSANDKAYTAASFKRDTSVMAEAVKDSKGPYPLQKLPHVLFFPGGVVIKIGDEIVGAIAASGAPRSVLDEACAKAGLDKIRDRLK
jgi:uncharacterized protein GlcG (DUF336 family)